MMFVQNGNAPYLPLIRSSQTAAPLRSLCFRLEYPMTTVDTFVPARRAPATSFFASIAGQFMAWNDRRVTVKMLSRLTDRELDDIGLERGDIATWSRHR